MVLFKRKPVGVSTPADNISDAQEVWTIAATGEVFVEYEKFLKRMDFLTQKKFTDAVNGKSGLTFFDAQESEMQSSNAIENVFPEVLRDPILRKVQFSTIGRMDDLVNIIFDEFKRDFFPGEDVIVVLDNGDAAPGTIREKAKFPIIRGPDGTIQREAFSRYFVRLPSNMSEEALVDDKHLRRDRKVFTKQNLRSFLKNSLQREAWTGAPWLVKEHLAIHYRLPMEIPAHLLQDFKLMQNKQLLQSKAVKGRRPKSFAVDDMVRPSVEHHYIPPAVSMESGPEDRLTPQMPQQMHYTAQALPPQMNGHQGYHPAHTASAETKNAPAVIKYPIEDLDLPPKQNGVTRPQLKFFTTEMEEYIAKGRRYRPQEIEFETLGMLLEVWTTLNVQAEIYMLDSCTFDDFVDAMKFSSDDVECELLNEVFCAVLLQLVDSQGRHQISLPIMDEDESETSEASLVPSEPQTPSDEPPARSTRSTRPSDANGIKFESPPASALKLHRAVELLEGFNWITQLGAREVEDGGWQMILVGALHQLSYFPHLKAKVDKVLAYLVPLEEEPSKESLLEHFTSMDINLRILALEIITVQSVSVHAVREFLETCSEDQTEVRKKKIEYQRARKVALEELAGKERERKILLPDNMADTPEPEPADEATTIDVDMEDATEETVHVDSGSDIEVGRSLRRNAGRKRKREEEQARAELEKAKKAAKTQPKQSKEFKKVLDDIEKIRERLAKLENAILDCDADLREASNQRTRVLGTDRFCNRYYWFERNGQPFAGLPTSSTASYGYSNGLIWVQGPSVMEFNGFIDLPMDLQAEYKARFRMTVPERRKQEEGNTILQSAHEWGYYDDADRLDSLMAWLDERGEREKRLLKELREWRDEIVTYMDKRKLFFEQEAAKKLEMDEEQATRISTRHAVQKDRSATAERCLRWHNNMAMELQKHLHSRNPARAKSKKKPDGRGVAQVVLATRSNKPATRQGVNSNYR